MNYLYVICNLEFGIKIVDSSGAAAAPSGGRHKIAGELDSGHNNDDKLNLWDQLRAALTLYAVLWIKSYLQYSPYNPIRRHFLTTATIFQFVWF